MMNCRQIQNLLPELADGTLEAAAAWQAETHLAECDSCRRISREFQSLQTLLQALPARQPSTQFDTILAQRLALTRRAAPRPAAWWDRFDTVRFFAGGLAGSLRPALACGVALLALAAFVWLPRPTPPLQTTAVHGVDRTFVADCVAQHRREASVEPLGDLAAQNLAGHLDTAPSPAAADEGLF